MKNTSTAILIAAALCLGHLQPLGAQQLRGVKELLILGAVSDSAANCGISRDQLETSATFIIRQSRLPITTTSPGQGTLAIQATRVAGTNPEWCVVHVEVAFSSTIKGTTAHRATRDSVTPFQQGSVFWGDPSDVQKQATDFVQGATKSFAAQWARDNP